MRRSRLIFSYAASALLAWAAGAQSFEAVAAATTALPERASSAQMVTVTVTPHDLSAAAWEFEVSLSTHVQPLDDDLAKSAALVDASGRRHAPIAWRGDAAGGHHRKGVLVFAPLQPRPASLELQIQRAGESTPRSFKWQLQ